MQAISSARTAREHAGRADGRGACGLTAGHSALGASSARRLAVAVALHRAARRIGAGDGARVADLELAGRARVAAHRGQGAELEVAVRAGSARDVARISASPFALRGVVAGQRQLAARVAFALGRVAAGYGAIARSALRLAVCAGDTGACAIDALAAGTRAGWRWRVVTATGGCKREREGKQSDGPEFHKSSLHSELDRSFVAPGKWRSHERRPLPSSATSGPRANNRFGFGDAKRTPPYTPSGCSQPPHDFARAARFIVPAALRAEPSRADCAHGPTTSIPF